jgi:hypothetical protein
MRAAAVLYEGFMEVEVARVHLGTADERLVNEAEAMAAVVELHTVLNRVKRSRRDKLRGAIDISIDNHAILKAKYNGRPNAAH